MAMPVHITDDDAESLHSADVSVLMSTYAEEKAERLRMALRSVFRQSVLPREIILVIDGPIDDHQEQVIREFTDVSEPVLKVLRLENNKGLASALNFGLTACEGSCIARMDSDDISRNDRIEKQFKYLTEHPEIDVVASWQAEFEEDDVLNVTNIKTTPALHSEIVNKLRWRNVISHPTIMIRKAALLRIQGYDETIGLLEDYDLHMRLIQAGSRYAAIQEPLVKVRTSPSQRARRGGWAYIVSEGIFRRNCYRRGYYSFMMFVVSYSLYVVFRLMPPSIKRTMYRIVRSNTPTTRVEEMKENIHE